VACALLHLTAAGIWACTVLLASLTGLNASVLALLPCCDAWHM
jgi:hypothetical protein